MTKKNMRSLITIFAFILNSFSHSSYAFLNEDKCTDSDNYFSIIGTNREDRVRDCQSKQEIRTKIQNKFIESLNLSAARMGCSELSEKDLEPMVDDNARIKLCNDLSKCIYNEDIILSKMQDEDSKKAYCSFQSIAKIADVMYVDNTITGYFKKKLGSGTIDSTLNNLTTYLYQNLSNDDFEEIESCDAIVDNSNLELESCASELGIDEGAISLNRQFFSLVQSRETLENDDNKDMSKISEIEKATARAKISQALNGKLYPERSKVMKSNFSFGISNKLLSSRMGVFTSKPFNLQLEKKEFRQKTNPIMENDITSPFGTVKKSFVPEIQLFDVETVGDNKSLRDVLAILIPNLKVNGMNDNDFISDSNLQEIFDSLRSEDFAKRLLEPNISKAEQEEIENKLNVSFVKKVSNHIFKKHCDKTTASFQNICNEITQRFKVKDAEKSNVNMSKIVKYLTENPEKNANISKELVRSSNGKDGLFDYNTFLLERGKVKECFYKKFLDKKGLENEYVIASIKDGAKKYSSVQLNSFEEKKSQIISKIKSSKEDSVFSGISIPSQNQLDEIKKGTNIAGAEDVKPQSNPISGVVNNNTTIPSSNSKVAVDDFKKSENGFTNLGNQFQNHLSSNPLVDNLSGHSVNNPLSKSFEDLSNKEAVLQNKVNSGVSTPTENAELIKLRQQIASMQTQIAANKKLKNSNIDSNIDSSSKSGTVSQVANQDTLKVAPHESAPMATSQNNNPFSTGIDSPSDRTGSFNPVLKSGGMASATATAKSSGSEGTAAKIYGIVLTKNGELTEDLSKVAENPKDADILFLIEKSNGSPFVIKENGQYLTVVPEMKDGKVVYLNGKPKIIKKKIDKNKAMLSALRKDIPKEDSMGALRQADTVPSYRLKQLQDAQKDALETRH